MAVYYCKECEYMGPETELQSFQGAFYCPKCRKKMVMMEGELSHISAIDVTPTSIVSSEIVPSLSKEDMVSLDAVDMIELECKDILKDDPANCKALFTLASRYYTTGKINEAKELCYQVIVLDSDHSGALQLLDRIQSRESQTHHLKDLEKKADSALGQQQYQEVERYCRELLSGDPSSVKARQLLASSYQDQGRYDEAITCLLELQQVDPEDPYLLYNLGVAYGMKQDMKKAIHYFELTKSKSKDPDLLAAIDDFLK